LPGNTVLTGYAILTSGLPGPFHDIDQLEFDDALIIQTSALEYVYKVRSQQIVAARNLSPLEHRSHDWVTLITCIDYDETTTQYRHRRVVQAVLVEIRPDRDG
jgi:LPXTG-site transpeptidase (sortase) family protein